MNTRRNRPLIIWIAMLAVLMGTLAPSMTSLLAAARGEIPLEICTTPYNRGAASLLAQQAAQDAQSPIDHTLLHDGGHCPYCRLQQEVPAMPHVPQPLVLDHLCPAGAPTCPHPATGRSGLASPAQSRSAATLLNLRPRDACVRACPSSRPEQRSPMTPLPRLEVDIRNTRRIPQTDRLTM